MKKEIIKIGFPMTFENEDGTIDNVVLLRPNEIKALEYKLQELDKYKNIVDKAVEYIEENKVDLSWFMTTDKDLKIEGISNIVSTFRLLEILKGE